MDVVKSLQQRRYKRFEDGLEGPPPPRQGGRRVRDDAHEVRDRKPEKGDLLFVSKLSCVVPRLLSYHTYDDNERRKVAVSKMVGTEGLHGHMAVVTCK
jgi:hypothetical protein